LKILTSSIQIRLMGYQKHFEWAAYLDLTST